MRRYLFVHTHATYVHPVNVVCQVRGSPRAQDDFSCKTCNKQCVSHSFIISLFGLYSPCLSHSVGRCVARLLLPFCTCSSYILHSIRPDCMCVLSKCRMGWSRLCTLCVSSAHFTLGYSHCLFVFFI